MVDRASLYSKLAQSRQALLATLEGLTEGQMTDVSVEGVWTIKDILGHIASWEATCVEPLRRGADGFAIQCEPIKEWLAFNGEQAALKRDQTLAQVMADLASVRQSAVDAIEKLPQSAWEGTHSFPWDTVTSVADLMDAFCGHEEEHVRAIRAWREA
jgi:hypothetical protein